MKNYYLKGWIYWKKLCISYRINYDKVVIVLSDENSELDKQVIKYLPEFIKRKHAIEAIVYCRKYNLLEIEEIRSRESNITIVPMNDEDMELLYSFYCFTKFFDNIVFTYISKPCDNKLGLYLKETNVNEKDAACLALYHLRHVPD